MSKVSRREWARIGGVVSIVLYYIIDGIITEFSVGVFAGLFIIYGSLSNVTADIHPTVIEPTTDKTTLLGY